MDIYMYWLSTLYMMGSRKQNLILKYFNSPKLAFEASDEALAQIPNITPNNIRLIQKNRNMQMLELGVKILENNGIHYTHLNHPNYPSLLGKIADPPIGLFHLGKLPSNNRPTTAIIGSRRCSDYGLNIARQFGANLARKGVAVISGMARGIDSMAHRGALEAKGTTIAVLGCGVDICYPAENIALKEEIAQNGCVVSEYPLGVAPRTLHFPARNRIISGLSQVVVVVEAGKKSGTLITVDQALDQGREVMAVPGNITNKFSEGTNNLIKQGAEPVCNYEDILNAMGLGEVKKSERKSDTYNNVPNNNTIALAEDEKIVYDILGFEAQTIDEIIVKTNSNIQTAQYILTMLELKGMVRKLPGMRYVKI